ELVPVDRGEVVAMRLAVAVLPGERSAVGDDELRGLVEEALEDLEPVARPQVEVDPAVHASLAVVAEVDTPVPVAIEQRGEIAKVGAEPRRVDGGVLERRPGLERLRDAACTKRRLAHEPDRG